MELDEWRGLQKKFGYTRPIARPHFGMLLPE
jgi:hypothetical protein